MINKSAMPAPETVIDISAIDSHSERGVLSKKVSEKEMDSIEKMVSVSSLREMELSLWT